MNYEKSSIQLMGNARALVQGTKHVPPLSDSVPDDYRKSIAAYESDE
jgi:hypothetical protein